MQSAVCLEDANAGVEGFESILGQFDHGGALIHGQIGRLIRQMMGQEGMGKSAGAAAKLDHRLGV